MSFAATVLAHLEAPAFLVEPSGACTANRAGRELFGACPTDRDALCAALDHGDGAAPEPGLAEVIAAAAAGTQRAVDVDLGGAKAPRRARLVVGPVGDGHALLVVDAAVAVDAAARAERLERLAAVGQLTAGVTHELNNVLTAVLGWTQIALRSPEQRERVEAALSIVEENGRRAKEIVGDVLGVARGDLGGEGRASLQAVLDDVLRVLAWELERRGVTVVRRYHDDAPVALDRRRMFQVFLNVVLNAIQAMPSGGELHVESRRADGVAEIELRDTGHGMDEETLARAFEPHFTTKVAGEGGGGSGLGLAISREQVEKLGGRITAASRPGEGTTLVVALPAGDADEEVEPRRGATGLDAAVGLHVLLVEHEPDVRSLLASALAEARVVATSTGVEALACCRRQTFDLAFVDLALPDPAGHALERQIRELQPGLRVVAMSDGSAAADRRAASADGFLTKPFDLEAVGAALAEAVAGRPSTAR